ncbi:unknown protein [Desulfotalea psychrophila LSv54]|uniref:Uncharacterized protein n=1 Tax=Desulfotalea psychrophila (strain LSv54 / DSM 12343) TaxID=177439 RepID=Q6APY6_DESPS|nr:unknown protein [Desulfotalea psychrophila LSv54]
MLDTRYEKKLNSKKSLKIRLLPHSPFRSALLLFLSLSRISYPSLQLLFLIAVSSQLIAFSLCVLPFLCG